MSTIANTAASHTVWYRYTAHCQT